MLREQAALIRDLAKIVDIVELRRLLEEAAKRCDHYASAVEETQGQPSILDYMSAREELRRRLMTDTLPLAHKLRKQAAEAIRITALDSEGTRGALQKIAAELLATAAEFEAVTTVVLAPQEAIEEMSAATDPKADNLGSDPDTTLDDLEGAFDAITRAGTQALPGASRRRRRRPAARILSSRPWAEVDILGDVALIQAIV